MKIKLLDYTGIKNSLIGLSLSYQLKNLDNIGEIANRLISKNKDSSGETKFLEFIILYFDITAPRYFWQEFDTYRIGVSKQSESTMHTITKKELNKEDFEFDGVDTDTQNFIINNLNNKIKNKESFSSIKKVLPESFLQRRMVCMNFKTLRYIVSQRQNHRLKEWKEFCNYCKEIEDVIIDKIKLGEVT